MFFVSASQADCVENCNIVCGCNTDHSLVEMSVNLCDFTRGPGSWKLNNKLLFDDQYVQLIEDVIANTIQDTPCMNPSDRWSEIKTKCAQASREYSKRKAQKEINEMDQLQLLRSILHGDHLKYPQNQDIIRSLSQVTHKIDLIDQKRTEASIFRSRCQWVKDGEKNSKLFFSLEKRNYMEKNMKTIITDLGKHIFNQQAILEEQTKFYKLLYKKDKHVSFNLKCRQNEPQLSEFDKIMCDAELSIDELYDGLMTLRSNKCPGGDGLTNEFYRKFFKSLSIPVIQMARHAFDIGCLPKSTRRGIISLLPKLNKDSRFVKHMHPLTLINSDYKIIAKALDNRLQTVLPDLIQTDQSGFIKGRCISTNVRKSVDVIEYTKRENIPAVIFSVDMAKCFDHISYSAIYGMLCHFNFGEKFIKWVSLFYSKFEVCTQNFRFFSDYFEKEKSVNQGCIISPAIFLLTGEVLANRLRNHKDIRGIKINDTEYLISQFADDMDLYLPYDTTVLNAVIATFSDIEIHTGLRVSYDKTNVYRIGSIANSDAKLYTVKKVQWMNDPIRTLVVELFKTNKEMLYNYESIIIKMQTITKTWYYRTLSLMGKVQVVNTLVSSLFIYKFQVLPYPPNEMIQRIEKIITDFIWSGKKAKIPLETLQKEKMYGGLGLTYLHKRHSALMIAWIQRIQENDQCRNLAKYFLGDYVENNMIWAFNLHENDIPSKWRNNNFWCQLLNIWCNYNYQISRDNTNITSQIVWYNSNIKCGGKILEPRNNLPPDLKISDMMINGTVMSLQEFKTKSNTTINWLDYRNIRAAILKILEKKPPPTYDQKIKVPP